MVIRRPYLSAMLPVTVGKTPEAIKYDVTVRLICCTDTFICWAMKGMAGKYMKLLAVENQPAQAATIMIQTFCWRVKAE